MFLAFFLIIQKIRGRGTLIQLCKKDLVEFNSVDILGPFKQGYSQYGFTLWNPWNNQEKNTGLVSNQISIAHVMKKDAF